MDIKDYKPNDYKLAASMFRQLATNCVQILKKVGVSEVGFAAVAEVAYQDCYKKYMEKKTRENEKT
jgi:hypothetical protein